MLILLMIAVVIVLFFVISLVLCILDDKAAKKENRKRNEGLVVLTAISGVMFGFVIAGAIVVGILALLIDAFMRSM